MSLGNTPTRETNFAVEASKSYAFGMRFITPDGVPVDLTDATVRLVGAEPPHRGGQEVLSVLATIETPSSGFVQFDFQAEDLALDYGSYAYDVTLIPKTGYSTPIIKGFFEVGSNTDLDTSNTFTEVGVGSEITVTLDESDVIEITIERVDGLFYITKALMEDFSVAMEAEVDAAEAHKLAAQSAEVNAASYATQMQVWLDNAGFPFWKGTFAEYQNLTRKEEVLYLITDEVTA